MLPGVPSDPFLMTNYDRKSLTLSHDVKEPVTFTIEVDFLGNGTFREYAKLTPQPGEKLQHDFPAGYSAKWVRFTAGKAAKATATLRYE